MKLRKSLTALAVTATATMTIVATGTAADASEHGIALRTDHSVGVYSLAYAWSSKKASDLHPGNNDAVIADCWVHGQNIGGQGDQWYHVVAVSYDNWRVNIAGGAFTYAPYVDDAYSANVPAGEGGGVPQC